MIEFFLPNTNFRQLPLIDERTKHSLSSPSQSQYWSRTTGGVRVQDFCVKKRCGPLWSFVSLYPVERREMCFLRCGMQMRLSAPFAPPLNPHLTVCVPEGSEAERSDQGYLRSREEERERDCAERQLFLESRGGELEKRKVAWGLQGLLWIICRGNTDPD